MTTDDERFHSQKPQVTNAIHEQPQQPSENPWILRSDPDSAPVVPPVPRRPTPAWHGSAARHHDPAGSRLRGLTTHLRSRPGAVYGLVCRTSTVKIRPSAGRQTSGSGEKRRELLRCISAAYPLFRGRAPGRVRPGERSPRSTRHRADPASPKRDHRHPEGRKASTVVRDLRTAAVDTLN